MSFLKVFVSSLAVIALLGEARDNKELRNELISWAIMFILACSLVGGYAYWYDNYSKPPGERLQPGTLMTVDEYNNNSETRNAYNIAHGIKENSIPVTTIAAELPTQIEEPIVMAASAPIDYSAPPNTKDIYAPNGE